MAEMLVYKCEFEDEHSDKLSLVFKIDTNERLAIMEGNLGMSKLDYHIGNEAFSLMESLSSGAVQTTTILEDGRAIHSRNTIILGELVPSQYKGNCKTYAN
jgi:hypothetical protein